MKHPLKALIKMRLDELSIPTAFRSNPEQALTDGNVVLVVIRRSYDNGAGESCSELLMTYCDNTNTLTQAGKMLGVEL